jgi:hypothetical protein
MKFITKIGVVCSTIAMMASTISYAGTVTTGEMDDLYIGAFGNNSSQKDYSPFDTAANYDIHWMQVAKTVNGTQGSLTVTVNSNFIGFDSKFKLGDLFLMDGDNYTPAAACTDLDGRSVSGCAENSYNSPNKWEYAFDLGLDLGDLSIRNSESNYNESGVLREIDQNNYNGSLNTSSELKSTGVRKYQIVETQSSNNTVGAGGNWNTNINNELLTMSFDISGTTLMGADQIALRWAMSCANDIIEVVADLTTSGGGGGGSTPVPEPSTFLLMLLAGFGFLVSRQKQDVKFKA